ncbi:MAG: hypothetical protein LBH58_03860 [Tannerellaceae bacterium]|jgi:hypothetical protein|nr:hypothetical protein [Tannerellaceae bacterium]
MKPIQFTRFITFFFCLGLSGIMQGEDYKKMTVETDLRDPFAFETAADMYKIAPVKAMDSSAKKIIRNISAWINEGFQPEDSIVWESLQQLEPYRMDGTVQEVVKLWAEQVVQNISQTDSTPSASNLISISNDYKREYFAVMINDCRNLLKSYPNHYDTRSNLALALIHTGKDLCAQIELEILTRQKKNHAAGLVNLVVVYERMNQPAKAEQKARELEKMWFYGNSMARFNAAWYRNKNREYKQAERLLSERNTSVEKHNTFRELNLKQLQMEYREYTLDNIIRNGLLYKSQLFVTDEDRTKGEIIAAGILLAFLIIYGIALGKLHDAKKTTIWFLMIILMLFTALCWVTAFGIYQSLAGQIMAVLYFLVLLIIFRRKYKKIRFG